MSSANKVVELSEKGRKTYNFSLSTAKQWHPLFVDILEISLHDFSRGSNISADLR